MNIIRRTPLHRNDRLSSFFKNNVLFKREDLQSTRSFKIRGAYHKMMNMNSNIKRVVTSSAGNHAQGVALVAKTLGITADIFVPEITPQQKINKIKYFGEDSINLHIFGGCFGESCSEALDYADKHGYEFVHPFDDPYIINGQSTIVDEIVEQIDNIDYLVVPVGGGGLISGLSKIKDLNTENIKLIGVEPDGANSLNQSMIKGERVFLDNIDRFVDGASVPYIGKLNYDICKDKVDDVFSVSNSKLCKVMIDMYDYEGFVLEPAGALSIAALDNIVDKYDIKDRNIVCIISGGNNDMLRYSEIYENKLKYERLIHYYDINFVQKSGELKKFMEQGCFDEKVDIIEFNYKKYNNNIYAPVRIGVQITSPKDIVEFEKYLYSNDIQFKSIKY